MRTRPISASQETANCIYNIPYECGRIYNGETGGRWTARLQEYRKKLEVGHLERSSLVHHFFEENHRMVWKEAKIIETN